MMRSDEDAGMVPTPIWKELASELKVRLLDCVAEAYPEDEVVRLLRLEDPEVDELCKLWHQRDQQERRQDQNKEQYQQEIAQYFAHTVNIDAERIRRIHEKHFYAHKDPDQPEFFLSTPLRVEKAKAYLRHCELNKVDLDDLWDFECDGVLTESEYEEAEAEKASTDALPDQDVEAQNATSKSQPRRSDVSLSRMKDQVGKTRCLPKKLSITRLKQRDLPTDDQSKSQHRPDMSPPGSADHAGDTLLPPETLSDPPRRKVGRPKGSKTKNANKKRNANADQQQDHPTEVRPSAIEKPRPKSVNEEVADIDQQQINPVEVGSGTPEASRSTRLHTNTDQQLASPPEVGPGTPTTSLNKPKTATPSIRLACLGATRSTTSRRLI